MEAGKLAVVTGASGGLGRALALAMAGAGYEVCLHYHAGKDRAEETRKRILEGGGFAFLCQADLGSPAGPKRIFREVRERGSVLKVLVNNAAVAGGKPIAMAAFPELGGTLDVNLRAAYECIREASWMMMRSGSGHIINIGSVSSFRPMAGQAAYAMSKAALVALTKVAALEFGRFGIRVNSVSPGRLDAGMGWSGPPGIEPIPVQAVAEKVCALCREDGPGSTGQDIVMDSGSPAVAVAG